MKKNGGKAKKFFAKLKQIYSWPIVTETKSEDYFTDNVNLPKKKGGQPTGSKAITPSRLVIKGFVLVFLFTIVILGSLAWYTWRSNQHLKSLETKHFRLLELSGQIIHIDEVLTMSAEMAAHSGELEWEDRYRIYEPQLDKAIKEVIELSPEKFMSEAISQTDVANIKLVAMENSAFDLVRQGQQQTAVNLLHSPEYKKQKEVYSKGINEIANEIGSREKARLKKERQIALTIIIFLIIAMPLVAFIWLAALRILLHCVY
jgi:CHASE3 domain sensor protein